MALECGTSCCHTWHFEWWRQLRLGEEGGDFGVDEEVRLARTRRVNSGSNSSRLDGLHTLPAASFAALRSSSLPIWRSAHLSDLLSPDLRALPPGVGS